jgi:hypothetical protein
MNHTIRRRASLGLAIQGPFSRNRRRRPWREFIPHIISAVVVLSIVAFFAALLIR